MQMVSVCCVNIYIIAYTSRELATAPCYLVIKAMEYIGTIKLDGIIWPPGRAFKTLSENIVVI